MRVQDQLQSAFIKSGMNAKEFYLHIVNTRKVINRDDARLSFKINVPDYDDDVEWFGFNPSTNKWEEL